MNKRYRFDRIFLAKKYSIKSVSLTYSIIQKIYEKNNKILKEGFIKVLEQHNISLVPIWDQNNNLHFRIACQKHKVNKLFIKELKKIENIEKYIILL